MPKPVHELLEEYRKVLAKEYGYKSLIDGSLSPMEEVDNNGYVTRPVHVTELANYYAEPGFRAFDGFVLNQIQFDSPENVYVQRRGIVHYKECEKFERYSLHYFAQGEKDPKPWTHDEFINLIDSKNWKRCKSCRPEW